MRGMFVFGLGAMMAAAIGGCSSASEPESNSGSQEALCVDLPTGKKCFDTGSTSGGSSQSCSVSVSCSNGTCTCGGGPNKGATCNGAKSSGSDSCSELCKVCTGGSAPPPSGSPTPAPAPTPTPTPTTTSTTPPPPPPSGGTSSYQCAINGARYSCPDRASFDKCDGGLSKCVEACGSNYICVFQCKSGPTDPSGCTKL